jgi:hypothetical protein
LSFFAFLACNYFVGWLTSKWLSIRAGNSNIQDRMRVGNSNIKDRCGLSFPKASDDAIELPPAEGPGIATNMLTQQRQEQLAGKKGIECRIEAQQHGDQLIV